MAKKIEKNLDINRLSIALYIMAGLDLLGIIFLFMIPGLVQTYAAYAVHVGVSFVIGTLLSALTFILCGFWIRKKSKIAYVFTWLLPILIILKLRIIGIILAIFMIKWLVRSKKEFFK